MDFGAKMNTVGIICEYNPFHTGHLHQIKSVKDKLPDACIVSLMSGEFVQRGGVAVIDKHTRAKIAVQNSSDLCIQLPAFYSTQVAEIFARGAVKTLDEMGIVNFIHFGSESGDIDQLRKNAKKIIEFEKNSSDIGDALLAKNRTYVSSKSDLIDSFPDKSNDILSIEYIKAIEHFSGKMQPLTIKRAGENHNSERIGGEFAGSSAIRKELFKSKDDIQIQNTDIAKYLPKFESRDFDKKFLKFDDDFFPLIKYAILARQADLDSIFEVVEGIENLILKESIESNNFDELIHSVKSKRYTLARIRRIMYNILLNIRKDNIDCIKSCGFRPPYIRVLAFNDKGRTLLKKIKQNTDLDIITKVADYRPGSEYKRMFFEKDILANKIYNIPKKSQYYNDYKTTPIYVR